MNRAAALLLSTAIISFAGRGPVFAGVLDVTAISCPTALHVADFNTCAKSAAQGSLRTGLYVASNPSSPLSSFVRVTGTISGCDRKTNCRLIGITTTPIKLNGDPVTTDADLNIVDQSLFAELRTTSEVTRPINIPLDYGSSYTNNPTLDEDTSSAISHVLYITRQINPNSVPLGTIVIVKWNDGTTAKFERVSMTGTLQWRMVPGTARDRAGHPINPNGTPVDNPHGGGGGDGGGSVTPTTDPTYWVIHDDGGSECSGHISVQDSGGITDFVFFFPC